MEKIIIVVIIALVIACIVLGGFVLHYRGRVQTGDELYQQLEITNSRIRDGLAHALRESRRREQLIDRLQEENRGLDTTIGELQNYNRRLEGIRDNLTRKIQESIDRLAGIGNTVDQVDRILQEVGKRQED